ncbi:hypothetical protein Dsin_022177, partial [Dipteronia sinensis]
MGKVNLTMCEYFTISNHSSVVEKRLGKAKASENAERRKEEDEEEKRKKKEENFANKRSRTVFDQFFQNLEGLNSCSSLHFQLPPNFFTPPVLHLISSTACSSTSTACSSTPPPNFFDCRQLHVDGLQLNSLQLHFDYL